MTDLTVAFNDTLDNNRVSSRTVRSRLTEEGYHRCKVTKTTTISRKNRNERLAWCRTKLKWTVNENWCKVIFSHETKIVLGKDRKVYVWRKPDEKYRPECVGQYSDHCPRAGISVMFWGCITINGVGTLTEVEGNIDSSVYLRVLDDNLWPVISKNFAEKTWILRGENCPVHRSKQTNTWKERNNIYSLPWLSQSPDINIIENLWRKYSVHLKSD